MIYHFRNIFSLSLNIFIHLFIVTCNVLIHFKQHNIFNGKCSQITRNTFYRSTGCGNNTSFSKLIVNELQLYVCIGKTPLLLQIHRFPIRNCFWMHEYSTYLPITFASFSFYPSLSICVCLRLFLSSAAYNSHT